MTSYVPAFLIQSFWFSNSSSPVTQFLDWAAELPKDVNEMARVLFNAKNCYLLKPL